VALALPCPALEAHVRQVLTERRHAVQESPRLRICDNGDLEVLSSGLLDTSSSTRLDVNTSSSTRLGTSSGPLAPHPVCTQVLDLSEMVHALAPTLPHLARVLAAHGAGFPAHAAGNSEAPVRSAQFFGAASTHGTGRATIEARETYCLPTGSCHGGVPDAGVS